MKKVQTDENIDAFFNKSTNESLKFCCLARALYRNSLFLDTSDTFPSHLHSSLSDVRTFLLSNICCKFVPLYQPQNNNWLIYFSHLIQVGWLIRGWERVGDPAASHNNDILLLAQYEQRVACYSRFWMSGCFFSRLMKIRSIFSVFSPPTSWYSLSTNICPELLKCILSYSPKHRWVTVQTSFLMNQTLNLKKINASYLTSADFWHFASIHFWPNKLKSKYEHFEPASLFLYNYITTSCLLLSIPLLKSLLMWPPEINRFNKTCYCLKRVKR